MGGVGEERGDGPTRYFGVVLLGAARFTPGLAGFGSSSRFTAALGLGLKRRFSEHLGFRADARGYYVAAETGGGVFCSGSCLFVFSASGLWQGDLGAGFVLAF